MADKYKNNALTAKRPGSALMREAYVKMSTKTANRIAFVIIFAVVAVIIYAAASTFEARFNIGYISEEKVSDITFSSQNRRFSEYAETVNVTLKTGQNTQIINTETVTVADFLGSIGIYPDDDDELSHPQDLIVSEGMNIVLRKMDVFDISLTEIITHETETVKLQTIPVNTSKTTQKGRDGLIKRILQQRYVDGVLESEDIISENIEVQVQNEITEVGVGGTFTAPNGSRYPFSYYIDVTATAYGGPIFADLTYTGKQVEVGMIAVDPSVIPLGSKCYVIGDSLDLGIQYAEDTGSKIIDNVIDVYMGPTSEDEDMAWQFGRKSVRVYILR